jgi:hypothetical protein
MSLQFREFTMLGFEDMLWDPLRVGILKDSLAKATKAAAVSARTWKQCGYKHGLAMLAGSVR